MEPTSSLFLLLLLALPFVDGKLEITNQTETVIFLNGDLSYYTYEYSVSTHFHKLTFGTEDCDFDLSTLAVAPNASVVLVEDLEQAGCNTMNTLIKRIQSLRSVEEQPVGYLFIMNTPSQLAYGMPTGSYYKDPESPFAPPQWFTFVTRDNGQLIIDTIGLPFFASITDEIAECTVQMLSPGLAAVSWIYFAAFVITLLIATYELVLPVIKQRTFTINFRSVALFAIFALVLTRVVIYGWGGMVYMSRWSFYTCWWIGLLFGFYGLCFLLLSWIKIIEQQAPDCGCGVNVSAMALACTFASMIVFIFLVVVQLVDEYQPTPITDKLDPISFYVMAPFLLTQALLYLYSGTAILRALQSVGTGDARKQGAVRRVTVLMLSCVIVYLLVIILVLVRSSIKGRSVAFDQAFQFAYDTAFLVFCHVIMFSLSFRALSGERSSSKVRESGSTLQNRSKTDNITLDAMDSEAPLATTTEMEAP